MVGSAWGWLIFAYVGGDRRFRARRRSVIIGHLYGIGAKSSTGCIYLLLGAGHTVARSLTLPPVRKTSASPGGHQAILSGWQLYHVPNKCSRLVHHATTYKNMSSGLVCLLLILCLHTHSACDTLRCTDCNFEVLCFDGRAWGEDTDYIFLRNNAPDPVKLSTRLQPSSGDSTCGEYVTVSRYSEVAGGEGVVVVKIVHCSSRYKRMSMVSMVFRSSNS